MLASYIGKLCSFTDKETLAISYSCDIVWINTVLTLYCVALHSGQLVVLAGYLVVLSLFWHHAVSHVHVHPQIILTHSTYSAIPKHRRQSINRCNWLNHAPLLPGIRYIGKLCSFTDKETLAISYSCDIVWINTVLTLYCVALHSGQLVVSAGHLVVLSSFWHHAVSHVHAHPQIILTSYCTHAQLYVCLVLCCAHWVTPSEWPVRYATRQMLHWHIRLDLCSAEWWPLERWLCQSHFLDKALGNFSCTTSRALRTWTMGRQEGVEVAHGATNWESPESLPATSWRGERRIQRGKKAQQERFEPKNARAISTLSSRPVPNRNSSLGQISQTTWRVWLIKHTQSWRKQQGNGWLSINTCSSLNTLRLPSASNRNDQQNWMRWWVWRWRWKPTPWSLDVWLPVCKVRRKERGRVL